MNSLHGICLSVSVIGTAWVSLPWASVLANGVDVLVCGLEACCMYGAWADSRRGDTTRTQFCKVMGFL